MKTQISIETKKHIRFFRIVALILCVFGSLMRIPMDIRTTQIIGGVIGRTLGSYFFCFCLASCITVFIKDKEKSKKVSSILIALFSLLYLIKGMFL